MHTRPKVWWKNLAKELNSFSAWCFRVKIKKTLWDIFKCGGVIQYSGKEVENVEEGLLRIIGRVM